MHCVMKIIAKTQVSNEEFNEHALAITVIEAREAGLSISFLQTFHHRFANATRLLLCKCDWQNVENMKHEPNNTHIPYIYLDSNLNNGMPSQIIIYHNMCLTLLLQYAKKSIAFEPSNVVMWVQSKATLLHTTPTYKGWAWPRRHS